MTRPGRKRGFTDEQLVEAVAANKSLLKTTAALYGKYPPSGSACNVVRGRIRELQLDTSHWKGQGWLRGDANPKATPLEEIMVEGYYYPSGALKPRLWKAGLLERKCYECGITEWRGQPAPLELDHINGNALDNRLENLRILCCNCHAQTPTWKGRNKNRPRIIN